MVPQGPDPSFSRKFDTLMLTASAMAVQLGLSDIDGATALIAIVQDGASNASAILVHNGFRIADALAAVNSHQPQASSQTDIGYAPQFEPTLGRSESLAFDHAPQLPPSHASISHPGAFTEDGIEDMLASVKSILEEDDPSDFAHDFGVGHPPLSSPSQPDNTWRERVEPSLIPGPAIQDRPQARPVVQAAPGLTVPVGIRAVEGAHGRGQNALGGPAAGFEAKKGKRRRTPNRFENAPPLKKLLGIVPRRAKVGKIETVAFELTHDEASSLFRGLKGGKGGEHGQVRHWAVSAALRAPEGGFFIEQGSPETQWFVERPRPSVQEPPGQWTWTLIPSESGLFALTAQLAIRDLSGGSEMAHAMLPDQSVTVRIAGGLWRGLWGLLKTLLLLLAGSGLTVGLFAGLKMMGKLPPWAH